VVQFGSVRAHGANELQRHRCEWPHVEPDGADGTIAREVMSVNP
jgi:hypothetical protein